MNGDYNQNTKAHDRGVADSYPRRSRVIPALAGMLLGLFLLPQAAAAEKPHISLQGKAIPVGAARVDITPKTPVRMYGYGSRKTESEGVALKLYARAVVFGGDDGQGPAVLLVVENGALLPSLVADVFRLIQSSMAVKPERFVLCHTHNHSGPNVKGVAALEGEEKERILGYCRMLKEQLVHVVRKALDDRRPCRLGWAEGKAGFAANRRVLEDGTWTGFGAVLDAPADHRLPMLCAVDMHGDPVAIMVNYACHCTTLRPDFKKIHGDWAGCAQQYIEDAYPGVVAVTCIGCGADADPYPHGTKLLAEKHGREVAGEVARLLKGAFQPIDTALTTQREQLQLPFSPPPGGEKLEQLVEKSWSLGEVRRRLEKGDPLITRPYTIATWTFGKDLAMVFLTGEVVVDIGLRLGRELEYPRLWVSAYAHEVPCYIISSRLLNEGGYEVRNSMSARVTFGHPEELKPPMEERIVRRVKGMLGEPQRQIPKTGVSTSVQ